MNRLLARALLLSSFFYALPLHTAPATVIQEKNGWRITMPLAIKPGEFIYYDSIQLHPNHPDIHVTEWHSSIEPTVKDIPLYQTPRSIVTEPTVLTIIVSQQTTAPIYKPALQSMYMVGPANRIMNVTIPLPTTTAKNQESAGATESAPSTFSLTTPEEEQARTTEPILDSPAPSNKGFSLTTWIEHAVTSADSLPIQLLLVICLGLLMSLTPCIYPMIPITVGILQQQARQSLAYNFLLSGAYAVGISTTFALLGVAAALGGHLFGSLLAHPLFIIALVILLIYLGLSMFDWYEIRLPQFLNIPTQSKHAGLLSAFIFGILSGSIASPCLSPGLALLLAIVATIGKYSIGFLLLFFFGTGLSIPLLIIGTFSSSFAALPRAGSWMVEIKKIFGFIIFGLCFYYLKALLPYWITLISFALFLVGVGIYYIYRATGARTTLPKILGYSIGILLCAGAVITGIESIKQRFYLFVEQEVFWNTDYQRAYTQAQQTNHYLFVDIWGQACSICSAIDKKIMHNHAVRTFLATHTVPVKVEAAAGNAAYDQLRKQYTIMGVPTFLLIDAQTNRLITQWSGELYELSPDQFIQLLQNTLDART